MTTSNSISDARSPATTLVGGPGPDPCRWKALALLCTAIFMVILDLQIAILALPSIQESLRFAAGACRGC